LKFYHKSNDSKKSWPAPTKCMQTRYFTGSLTSNNLIDNPMVLLVFIFRL